MGNYTDYFKVGRTILFIVALVLIGQTLFAQPSEVDEKIKMRIFIERDGEKRVFDKAYSSEEDMEKDPSLRAFKNELCKGSENVFLFGDGSFMPPPPTPPSHIAFFDATVKDNLKSIDFNFSDSIISVPLPPSPPRMDSALEAEIENFHKLYPDSTFYKFLNDSNSKDGYKRNGIIIHKRGPEKKLTVEDDLNKSATLKLDNFNYFPNPSNGTFRLEFNTPRSAPLSIKIFDNKGDVVYMEKVETSKGHYNKQIDLSDKQKGTYILEINQMGKGLTKKIVIE